MTNPPRVPADHVCHCGKRFLRKEHLRRHEASHQAPSFSCPECRRSFTRNDMLQRHAARHHDAKDGKPVYRSRQACDACRANKTKCSGGTQCLLCAKREIACTYNRSVQDTNAVDGPIEGTVSQVSPTHHATTSVTIPSPTILGSSHTPGFDATADHEVEPPPALGAAPDPEIAPEATHEEPHTTACVARAGMLLALTAIKSRPRSLDALLDSAPPSVRAWFTDCCTTYMDGFHIHWPVIPMVQFDIARDPLDACLPVVIIGCWLQGEHDGEAKNLAIEAHQRLVDRYFREMTGRDALLHQNKAWEAEKYQGICLSIVFAFYSMKQDLITRATLLLALSIATLRKIGIFCAERAEYQEKTHFPGTFLPYLLANRQQWIRLATYLFKIDTYMSITTGQHPTINPHELNIGLASTCSVWDARGLGKMLERLPLGPSGRDAHRLGDVLQDPWLLRSDMFLVEDATLGLCALFARVWEYCHLARRQTIDNSGGSLSKLKVELLGYLEAWKERLEGVSYLCESAAMRLGETATEFPLQAYCDQNSESSASALHRARYLIHEASVLHGLLGLHLHADLQTLEPLVVSLRDGNTKESAAKSQEWKLRVSEWARSADGRKAVTIAVAILDEETSWQDMGHVPPLADVALSAGSVVVRACIEYGSLLGTTCDCLHSTGSQDWTQGILDSGGAMRGKKTLDSLSICECNAEEWERRFGTAQQRVKVMRQLMPGGE
ncbi:hypothetical protein B0H63DRAFT_197642 [Podospora didyma]|uniref:Uncharacterized protein n=1 Tax=Podospora didyma TaxID=330526 RepID=A0AAE0NGS6_9PEZI|nr:hypothetical protein B0H63DRAFT_197642 [Podospora didyma]